MLKIKKFGGDDSGTYDEMSMSPASSNWRARTLKLLNF